MVKLRIKGLLVSLGYCESIRSTVMPVQWTGRPFDDPRVALRSFATAIRDACKAPAPKAKPLAKCCTATKAAKPKARACPDCGRSFAERSKKLPDADPVALLDALWRADVDGWNDALPRWLRDSGDSGECVLSGWRFFGGMPDNCDVVEVDNFDAMFRTRGARIVDFVTIRVGKRASQSRGRIVADEVE